MNIFVHQIQICMKTWNIKLGNEVHNLVVLLNNFVIYRKASVDAVGLVSSCVHLFVCICGMLKLHTEGPSAHSDERGCDGSVTFLVY